MSSKKMLLPFIIPLSLNALAFDNISEGETVTLSGNQDSPENALNLFINGTLNIGVSDGAGGVLNNYSGFIGGSDGRVVVTGNDSQWNNSSFLYVGHTGNGSLFIREGGLVTNISTGVIGLNSSASGTAEVTGSGSTWNALNGLVVGSSGTGTLIVADGGTVNTTNMTLGLNTGANGIFNVGGDASAAPGALVGQSIAVGQGTGSIILNHNASDYVLDSTLNGGADNAAGSGTGLVGNFLIDSLNGRTIFNSDHGDFTGTLQARNDGILNVNGNMSGADVMLLEGGMLEGTGRVGNITNGGTIAPGNSIGTLTVDGNYHGNGGTLLMESVLGDDNSPTDRLVITGSATGDTQVKVVNLNGEGALTQNGIPLIYAAQLSDGNAFTLSGDYMTREGEQAVISGAYAYALRSIKFGEGRWWYLTSDLTNPQTPEAKPPVVPTPEMPEPGTPTPGVPVIPQTPEAKPPVVPTPETPEPGTPTPSVPVIPQTPEAKPPVVPTPETPEPGTPTPGVPVIPQTPEVTPPIVPTPETPEPGTPTPSVPVIPQTPEAKPPVVPTPETPEPGTPTPGVPVIPQTPEVTPPIVPMPETPEPGTPTPSVPVIPQTPEVTPPVVPTPETPEPGTPTPSVPVIPQTPEVTPPVVPTPETPEPGTPTPSVPVIPQTPEVTPPIVPTPETPEPGTPTPGVPVIPQIPDENAPKRYHPGAALYEQYPQILAELNRMPTLHERISDIGTDTRTGAWGRMEGNYSKNQPVASTTSAQRKMNTWTLQTGVDGALLENNSGLLTGGINFRYGKANANINAYSGNGDINTTGYGPGLTLTWYGDNGFYIDSQAHAMFFDSSLHSDTLSESLASGNKGKGYAGSLETGWRLDAGNGYSLTPQAQIVWSRVNFDSFEDKFGTKVSLNEGESLLARAGIRGDKRSESQAQDGTKTRTNLHVNVNVYQELAKGTAVNVADVQFSSRDARTQIALSTGGTLDWSDGRYEVYGNVGVQASPHKPQDNYGVGGNIGVRVRW